MKPHYQLENYHPYGWLICSPPDKTGIPVTALEECRKIFPKDAVIDAGICHHFNQSGKPEATICITNLHDGKLWHEEIEKTLKHLPEEIQWWRGVDVGTSAASIFAVFCQTDIKQKVKEYCKSRTPQDAEDFGRCQRLLTKFPEWKKDLQKVAIHYPNTAWPAIIAKWKELENANDAGKNKILKEIQK